MCWCNIGLLVVFFSLFVFVNCVPAVEPCGLVSGFIISWAMLLQYTLVNFNISIHF